MIWATLVWLALMAALFVAQYRALRRRRRIERHHAARRALLQEKIDRPVTS